MNQTQIIIILSVFVICCIFLSIFSGVGGYFLLEPSSSNDDTDTDTDTNSKDNSSGSGTNYNSASSGSSGSGSSDVQTPDVSGNTYWDCMIGEDKKSKVQINWGHTSGDGEWACNKWRGECDKKCTAKFSDSQSPSSGSSGSGSGSNSNAASSSSSGSGSSGSGSSAEAWYHEAWDKLLKSGTSDLKLIKWTKGKCLTVLHGKNVNGNPIVTYDCNKDDKNQQFIIKDGQIQWANGTKCINLKGGSLKNSTKIVLWDCNDKDENNIWDIKDGKIYIQKANAKSEEKPWSNCTTWDEAWEGKQHHDWCENQVGEAYKHVGRQQQNCTHGFGRGMCQIPSKCMNVQGGSTDNNTNIILWECDNDDENSKFEIKSL